MVSTSEAPAPELARLLRGRQALTVDLDGTLADIAKLRRRMWPALLRSPRVVLGWSQQVEATRGSRYADPRSQAVGTLADALDSDRVKVDQVVAREIDERWPRLYRFASVPAALTALMAAARRMQVPIVVVSDYPALPKLDAMGLSFDLVVDCRALGALKPLPDGLCAAAALVGVPVSSLLHVGDRWDTDGGAAAACGARFVHIDHLVRIQAARPTRPLV